MKCLAKSNYRFHEMLKQSQIVARLKSAAQSTLLQI